MHYVLAVKSAYYGDEGASLALKFAQALISQGHHIDQIFFFQNGVMNANNLIFPANDEINLVKEWQDLAEAHQIPLYLCIAAAQRRGVVSNETSQSKQDNNLAKSFVLAGLSEFIMAVLQADRLITI